MGRFRSIFFPFPYLEWTFYDMAWRCYNYNPPFSRHLHSLHKPLWIFWMLIFPTFHMIKEILTQQQDVNSQIKMCFWPVKADVSLTGCPISMLSASCVSANYPLLFTSLWSTLSPAIICLLPRDFVPTSFSCWSVFFFLFLNIYPHVWHDLHTFPSHLLS